MTIIAIVLLLLALIPGLLFLANLREYRRPEQVPGGMPPVSVLIPARNEEQSIGAAVESALASVGIDLEVIVLDDHSEDRTAEIVRDIATKDSRARLVAAPSLPAGWCGKQHACAALAEEASHPILVFLDADVRLRPEGLAQAIAFLESSKASLVSGVPHQETGGFLEKLVLPLIHFVLLGFLPLRRMRASTHPAYAAGCGQLFITRKTDYEKAGGHAAIRASLHDGITLPRAYRNAGLATDLFDATEVADCRMYRSGGELWRGLTKNATEGLGNPRMIVPATLLLLGGQVVPLILLLWLCLRAPSEVIPIILLALATGFTYLPRLAGAIRFRQSWLGALLHPIGIILLLGIQWHGCLRKLFGRPAAWKGRSYEPSLEKAP